LKNCPISVVDSRRYISIYGTSVHSLYGKTTRSRPHHVEPLDVMPLPDTLLKLHRNVVLCVDVLYINKMLILRIISRRVFFTVQFQDSLVMVNDVTPYLIVVISMYTQREFVIKHVFADGKLSPLREPLILLGITLNITAANEHVPEIERGIRFLKERTRCVKSNLPYDYYPRVPWNSTVPSVLD